MARPHDTTKSGRKSKLAPEDKNRLIEEYGAGAGVAELARRYLISESTVIRIIRKGKV